ncbi:MAG: beta-propeller domain-containing protein [Oscillospiraceae bacterium]|nr:beta-propeller domain-containing protein [Oscillospiraceae bacterium]
MANKNSVYWEMMQNISVPERLEPDNIVAFLEAKQLEAADATANADVRRSEITVTTNDVPTSLGTADKAKKPEKKITVSSASKRTRIYRTVASLAACAALALGCVRYFDLGSVETVETDSKGSSYASDYDELHKTFRKYYADDEDKVTLDSAIAEIENSYNESGTESSGDTSAVDSESTDAEADPSVTTATEPESTSPTQEEASESVETTTESDSEPEVTLNEGVRLPEIAEGELEGDYLICNDIIYIKDGSTVKVIRSVAGTLEYIGDAVPENGLFETRVLEEIYAVDSRLVAVYSVTTEEPISIPADTVSSESSVVEDILSSVYSEETSVVTSYSAEVVVYDISTDGSITTASVISFSGSYLDSVFKDGYAYVVTSYDQYHNMPLTGDNLDSYVPSYTVNGEKLYIEATSILIPETVSTLDYTVVGGIAAALPGTPVSVQAVLGSEGKVVVSDDAVYVFGYTGTEETSVEKLNLYGGTASFTSSATIEGVALTGGITLSDETLLVAALRSGESGYITAVYAFDENLNLLSEVDFPTAYQSVSFDGLKVALGSGSDMQIADFTSPSSPAVVQSSDSVDLTHGLMSFGDGYVTLTEDDSGYLTLSYLVTDNAGELTLSAEAVISTEDCDSPALSDNRILYLDTANGLIGVPYKYFDGYDYCCTYAIYKLGTSGFTLVGTVETHEVDSAFEFGRAELSNGILYVMSDGRVYALSVGESSVSIVGSADLIESSYSGHTTW